MFDPRVDSIIAELKRLNQHFCKKVKCCLGISNTGNPNLVLNQQGNWVANNDSIQDLLSDLPEYLGAKEASEDGKPIGYWYYNTFSNIITKVTNFISSFTAGISQIDFINNGGDDWTVGFKIAVSDLPSGWSVVDYDYSVVFVHGGTQTNIESGTKTTDYDVTSNLTSNGAGVYALSSQYNMTNGVDNLYILIGFLIKVDGAGNIIGSIKNEGLKVNSTNGLDMNYTAYVTQVGVSETVNIDAVDGTTFANTNLSHSLNDTITLPIGTGAVAVYTDLDPTFWADLGSLLSNPFGLGSFYLTIIS